MAPPRLRSLIEDPRFAREKQAIQPDARLMDEALFDAVWTLARQPETGEPSGTATIWQVSTGATADVPELVVYYTFDDDAVTLRSVEVA